MFESIRNIKSLDDIRVEKARMRYEALLAEKNLNESMHAFEKLWTFFSTFKRTVSVFQQAFHLFSRMSSFFGRMFTGFKKQKEAPEADETVAY